MAVKNSYPQSFVTAMMDKESLPNRCSTGIFLGGHAHTHGGLWREDETEKEKEREREKGRR